MSVFSVAYGRVLPVVLLTCLAACAVDEKSTNGGSSNGPCRGADCADGGDNGGQNGTPNGAQNGAGNDGSNNGGANGNANGETTGEVITLHDDGAHGDGAAHDRASGWTVVRTNGVPTSGGDTVKSFGTLDLKMNFLRPVSPDGRHLIARASVEQRGRTIAVSTARIDDADGKRVAMATGSAMISEGRPWPTPGE